MLCKIQKFNLVNELDSWYGTKERSFSEWPRDLDPHDTQLSLYKGDYSQFSSHLIHGNVYFENLIRPKVTLKSQACRFLSNIYNFIFLIESFKII